MVNGKEASDIIEDALNKVLSSNEDYEEGDQLTDWVLIAYTTNPDKEKGGAYPMFFSNGMLPEYKTRGLLSTGMLMSDTGLISSFMDDEED